VGSGCPNPTRLAESSRGSGKISSALNLAAFDNAVTIGMVSTQEASFGKMAGPTH
jgi:hypothetical protein